jgi:hypothetical protein
MKRRLITPEMFINQLLQHPNATTEVITTDIEELKAYADLKIKYKPRKP